MFCTYCQDADRIRHCAHGHWSRVHIDEHTLTLKYNSRRDKTCELQCIPKMQNHTFIDRDNYLVSIFVFFLLYVTWNRLPSFRQPFSFFFFKFLNTSLLAFDQVHNIHNTNFHQVYNIDNFTKMNDIDFSQWLPRNLASDFYIVGLYVFYRW